MSRFVLFLCLATLVFACPDEIGCMSCSFDKDKKVNICNYCFGGFVTSLGYCDFKSFEAISNCVFYEEVKKENKTEVICKTCNFGFKSFGKSCEPCKVEGCALCNDIDKCTGCLRGRRLIFANSSSANDICDQDQENPISNCEVSHQKDFSSVVECHWCKTDFATDLSQSECFPSPINYCKFLKSKTDKKCHICDVDFHVTKSGACKINYCREKIKTFIK